MTILVLFGIAVGLSMDAFAVSVCKGLSVKQLKASHALLAGLYFGGFQGLMPLIGYFLGKSFAAYIEDIDHWVAFVLLALIGVNMIRESFGEAEEQNDSFSFRDILPLAVATSIDAFAVGVTFACSDVAIVPAVLFIACTTFVFSAIGVKIGNLFGAKYGSKAELCGGIILCAMGLKILLDGLGIL